MVDAILLTGATGTLGSQILPRILERNLRVFCLVRQGTLAHGRMSGPAQPLQADVTVVRGDICEPLCAVSREDIALLRNRVACLVHCAASIDFSDEAMAFATNVSGVRNVLDLAATVGASRVYHVSTAYIAGDAPRFRENELDVGQHWRNAYEQSKYVGETLLHGWANAEAGRRFTIVRPSILVGCESGETPAYDAYYGYFRPLHEIANAVRDRAGRGSLPQGVTVTADRRVFLPVALVASPSTTLNLVPVDWAADMLVELLGRPSENKTFHLVHPRPPSVRRIIDSSLQFLRIEGTQCVATVGDRAALFCQQPRFVEGLQRRIDQVHNRFLPYTTHEARFETGALQLTLGTRFRLPPPIDDVLIRRWLSYAVDHNWGARARTQAPNKSVVPIA